MTEKVYVIQLHFRSSEDLKLKHFSGFIARGLFFNIVSRNNALFPSEQHEKKQIAPYSCSPIMQQTEKGSRVLYRKLSSNFFVSFTVLDGSVSNALVDYFRGPEALQIKISNSIVRLEELKVYSYGYSDFMGQQEGFRGFVVDFLTPTSFRKPYPSYPMRFIKNLYPNIESQVKSRYRFYPFPDPQLMFRNLLRIWKKFSDYKLPYNEYIGWLDNGGVVVSGFENMRTHIFYEHETTKKWIVGFTGRVNFSMPEDIYSQEMAKITRGLVRFGELVNTGVGRTAGFGMVRLVG